MRSTPVRAVLALGAAVVAAVVAVDAGIPVGVVLEALALGGATLVAVRAVGRLPVVVPPRSDERPRSPVHDDLASAAVRLHRATASAHAAWVALGPLLRPLVRRRCTRHGVDPDDPAAVRALVGDVLADLAGPDARRPTDRRAPGPTTAALDAALTRLEQL